MKTQIQTNRMPAILCAAILTLAGLSIACPAAAATDTWNGGAVPDGNWANPGNWNGVTPATNDLLVFTGGTQTAATNNFPAGMPFNNISFSSGASAFTLRGNSMVLSSPTDAGSGQIAGGSISSASTKTNTILVPMVLASGNHTIAGGTGTGFLKLNGTLTRSNGAVLTMSGNINGTGALSTNGLNNILGGWAVYGNNWATLDVNNTVTSYTGYTDIGAGATIPNNPAANVRIPINVGTISLAASGVSKINSLFFGSTTASAGNQTVNILAGNTVVLGQNGGIFNNTGVAGGGAYRTLTIDANNATRGILTAGDGIHPAQITLGSAPLPSASGDLVLNSTITDNGSAPVSVTVAGAYINLNGINTYSGGTYILQGRVSQPTVNTFGFGPVYIVSGGQANTGTAITNDFYLEGSGTIESSGMGALRMFGLAALSGTIHLTANAVVGGNGNANASGGNLVGIRGKITGPGGLTIGSPTSTSSTGGGTIYIGRTDGTSGPNDYAGDTTIAGTAGGSVNSALEIVATGGDNNIMPHGSTGSYAGGKTGNLILNGVAGNRQAIFDLNGSIQTINGLSSTATSPANDIVKSSNASGTLILGDNNATATYGGILQDGSGLSVTKIGAGTETLSGANTYTGNTVIQAGALVTTTASSGPGNYSVSNSAALGVTAASSGTTLTMNNLTFGASGASLQLNAASFGNPTAPLVTVNGALNMNGNVNVSLSGVGLTAGGPFTVLTYNPGNRTGSGNFVLANSPRVVGTLNDDMAGNVTITITSADAGIKWKGGAVGNWDISNNGNSIWQTFPSGATTYYIESGSGNDVVQFDDTATGTTNVNLTTTLTPQSITVSNLNDNYLFYGPGKLTGSTGLTKYGTGALTIANSGNNDFSGPIALNAGTLIVSNNSSFPNTLSGSGALTKNGNGTLTVSGDGSGYTGPVAVNGGILSVRNTASLALAAGITVANGATLDIGNNNVNLALEPVTVSGSGVGGNGAVVNSSGYNLAVISTSFQNLTLTGDTTIGGPGRLDFRSTDVTGGSDAVLNCGGHDYKLTKLSPSILQLSSVQIANGLGDIDVQGGTLGFSGNMLSLGNPNNTITVFGSATVQFNAIGGEIKKILVLNDNGIFNNSGSSNTYDGPVTLLGNGLFNIGNGTTVTFTNAIGGTGGTLSKITGTGALYLDAPTTYTGNTIIGAGSLFLTEPASLASSRSITIGSGATLDTSGRADQTLTLANGQTLSGTGTVNGNLTNSISSTVAPGTSTTIGTLTINTINNSGTVALNGTNILKVVETNQTCDLLSVGGLVQFGGVLQVMNLAGSFHSGDTFQIFTSSGFGGSFNTIIPASPGYNLAWDTNTLATSGVLSVIGPGPDTTPTNLITSFAGGNLTLSWPMDHTGWRLQVQTNSLSTGLGSNWTDVPGSTATNQLTIPAGMGNGSVFYRMVYP